MKKGLIILSVLLPIFSCKDDQPIPPKEEIPLPSYIKNLLAPDTNDPYEGSYYIHVIFTNNATSETQELTFDENNTCMAIRYDSSDTGVGVSEQTVIFINSPLREQLEISFYYNLATDTAFHLCYANYVYGDALKGVAGANIQYLKPVDGDKESIRYVYEGVDATDSYFRITYLENGRENGVFHTTWKECCGEMTTYKVTGDFSIPAIGYYKRD